MTATASVSASLTQLPDQRTAVVTGAGGPAGIGRVTARLLAENGWQVALIDINADGLAAVESELRAAGHENLLAIPTNIASESSVAEAFERIDAELAPVVGLVNLAGIACTATLHECELAEFDRVMGVNVTPMSKSPESTPSRPRARRHRCQPTKASPPKNASVATT